MNALKLNFYYFKNIKYIIVLKRYLLILINCIKDILFNLKFQYL
jgi:hypothetical protein